MFPDTLENLKYKLKNDPQNPEEDEQDGGNDAGQNSNIITVHLMGVAS